MHSVAKLRAENERLRGELDNARAFALQELNRADEACRKAAAIDGLINLLGYWQDASQEAVRISQDDATRSFILEVGREGAERTYYGVSLIDVIRVADIGETR